MKIPLSTYRLQFTPEFGFKSAKQILPYLRELGVSDIYASPVFKAQKGSQHGYDVVDPTQLNSELGATDDLYELTDELKKSVMGWVQDIVPNHMAYDSQNELLMNVLENGKNSPYFDFFDIEWEHPYESIRGRILAPFLGAFYGECLENGEIQLKYSQDGLSIQYYDHKFPVKIESYANVFGNLGGLKTTLGSDNPDYIKLLGVMYSLRNLPSEPEGQERQEQIRFIKRMFWELYTQNTAIHHYIDGCIQSFNGQPGVPESFNRLDALLSEQFFRLSFWKVGSEELNYRRFFNINGLITMRMEDEKVFRETHSLIARLVKEGRITGLRIDHLDGLYDPCEYLNRLRQSCKEAYIVAEKILEHGEELPETWPIQGTSGYDFLNLVNGLFCRRENELRVDKIYRQFSELTVRYADLVIEKKRLIIDKHMTGDVDNLAHLVAGISSQYRYGSDFTLHGLRRALVEVLAHFSVYRTYLGENQKTEADEYYIHEAIKEAKRAAPDLEHEINYLAKLLLAQINEFADEKEQQQALHFAMRFQQFTGPLMAKGFEDTALYIYNRLLSLNDVGGNPGKFGISTIEFHHFNKKRASQWPHTMNTTSTHDTKRGEDVRARINVLSEIPEEWQQQINLWSKINAKCKREINSIAVPDSNDEYFLYQTLIGTFPFSAKEHSEFVERIKDYIIKAVREAKVHTAWLKPDSEYEEAFMDFVGAILDSSDENGFLKEFLPFQKKIAYYGMFNSLSQALIKMTSPGVPDLYQGTEFWDLTLVDPDNRRPVDYDRRRSFLKDVKEKMEKDMPGLFADFFKSKEDGKLKLFLIYQALMARRKYRDIFEKGSYIPVEIGGKYKDHILAFARSYQDSWAITVAPRFLTGLIAEGEFPLGKEVWEDTHIVLPEGASLQREALTRSEIRANKTLQIGEALKHFPAALLVGT